MAKVSSAKVDLDKSVHSANDLQGKCRLAITYRFLAVLIRTGRKPTHFMHSIIARQIEDFIGRRDLIRPGQHVLAAVSGGADSVALLHILKELAPSFKLRLTVAHLHHKIRGKEADKDALFVKQLARTLRLGFAGGAAPVPELARKANISLEMAGRRARYSFFEKAALKLGCDAVATAHTADDNAETILIMLLRGCGLTGLTGIFPSLKTGKIKVIRPLLGTSRVEIEKYLRARKIEWREDLSNRDFSFLRNRVRHELLPLLETKYNRNIRETLNRMGVLLREENDFIESAVEKAWAEAMGGPDLMIRKFPPEADQPPAFAKPASAGEGRSVDKVASQPSRGARRPPRSFLYALGWAGRSAHGSCRRPDLNLQNLKKHHIALRRRILRRWLTANGIDSEKIDFQLIGKIDNLIMRPDSGGEISLTGELAVRKRYSCLVIKSRQAKASGNYRIKIKIPGTTVLPGTGLRVEAKIGPGVHRERSAFGKYPAKASLSLQKWRRKKIWARNWRPGDRMRPYGMKGSKKIQDIFGDAKAPVELRHSLPIFGCGNEIIWIPGYRIARGWEVAHGDAKSLHLMVSSGCS